MKFSWEDKCFKWGGPDNDWYWFYFWNPLPKKYRYFGHTKYYYDHPIGTFGFWWFNWSWFTPWTKDPDWIK